MLSEWQHPNTMPTDDRYFVVMLLGGSFPLVVKYDGKDTESGTEYWQIMSIGLRDPTMFYRRQGVVAWAELPAPYKGQFES